LVFQLQLGKAGEREGEGKSLEVGRWKAGCGKAALLAVVMVGWRPPKRPADLREGSK